MKKLILFCAFFIVIASVYSQNTIAVMDFQANGKVAQKKVDKLSEVFNTYFRPKGYILMDRSQLIQLVEGQGLPRTSLTEEQKVKIGEELNLTAIVCGEVKNLGNLLSVEVGVLDIHSQKLIHSESVVFAWKNYKNTMRQFASHYSSSEELKSNHNTSVATDHPAQSAENQKSEEEIQNDKKADAKPASERTVMQNSRPCKEKTVRDVEGNVYNTILIGRQCWMRENMRSTKGSNGNILNFYIPNGNATNVPVYGYLYDWPSAKSVCPKGWHLPTKEEWEGLEDQVVLLGMSCDDGMQKQVAKALASESGWQLSMAACAVGNNQHGNNTAGFNILPAGLYNYEHYNNFGYKANFWCSKDYDTAYAYSCGISFDNAYVKKFLDAKTSGFSVRCIHD